MALRGMQIGLWVLLGTLSVAVCAQTTARISGKPVRAAV